MLAYHVWATTRAGSVTKVGMYPSTSLVVASHYDLFLLYGEWQSLEMWLLSLENACVEAVLTGHM